MFNELESAPQFAENEKKIIKYWDDIGAVEMLKEARKDREEKVYYDGPITANNMPHYGHAITWTMKDIVPRYWSMKNYYVSRNMGWDCQGIPVEYEVEKALGLEHKEDIEKYGVDKFNALCRDSVFKYRDSIFYYEKRVGRWFDDNDMYYTMDKDFIESMWWSLKELYKKGLLYEGHKVVAYSTRAGTSLSTHEVTDGGYKEVEDPSITVKFKLKDEENTYFLAWTTTPWTIPGNLLLAVGPKVKYIKVQSENNFYILAEERVEEIFEGKEYKVVEEMSAKDLIDIEYIPPFDHFEDKRKEGLFKVISSPHATTEEGTGIVHLAPYGAEDFEIFMNMGIELFDYLDDTANFTSLIPEYEGQFYKKANKQILIDLEDKQRLFLSTRVVHRMPMCWRTGTPLIYKPIKSWYVAVTKIKDKMLKQNQKLNWLPEHLKDGMSKQWLSGARDWALSRKRYWGTPLPIWINDKTEEMVFIGSFEELKELSGIEVTDPHRPYVDDITWEDKKKGGTFRRVEDVIDVWYDSGSVPFAKLHYPFENKDKFDVMVPADYISEGLDQVRLWFYTMHVLGVALFDEVPYKNVVTTGMLLDKHGKKLSKSKKNFPPMDEVLDEFGGDILRLFLLNSPIVQAESARFYREALIDVKKEFFLPLWNSVRYFVTYANANKFEPSLSIPKIDNVLDKWILARLQQTINTVTEKMDEYKFMEASRQLSPFISDLSTWYIRRSRERLRSGDRNAFATLHYVLSQFAKLIAPMTPFLAESLYEHLGLRELTKLASVHFDLYPKTKKLSKKDLDLINDMRSDRDLVSSVLAQRGTQNIPIRQPLQSFSTAGKVYFEDIVKDEVNVKEALVDLSLEENVVQLDTNITQELKYEYLAREMIRKIQSLRKKASLTVGDKVVVVYPEDSELTEVVKVHGDNIRNTVGAISMTAGEAYEITKES
jgi:isoleucyl-tRNA synthetase